MKTRYVDININEDNDAVEVIGDSISSKYRIKILSLLTVRSYSTQELLNILDIAPATLSFHLKVLKDAGLIKYVFSPSKKGGEKNVSLNVEKLSIDFTTSDSSNKNKTIFLNIPVGSFSNSEVVPPCLIATKNKKINPIDNTLIFKSIERTDAQIISFFKGFLEYTITSELFSISNIKQLTFTQEICSECPNYNNNWKSDISFWINDIKVGTFLSNGDYGGRKGRYSPDWWPINSSNYGVLVKVEINEEGTFINGKKESDVTISQLNIKDSYITYKIGVDQNSKYVGGLNIFGKDFGDYKQDIEFIATFE